MEIVNKEDVLQYFENLELSKDLSKREAWGIFVNGKRISLTNGKVVWNKKNHASAAMRNEFERLKPNWYDIERRYKIKFTWGGSEQNTHRVKYRNYCTHIDTLYEELKNNGTIQFLPV